MVQELHLQGIERHIAGRQKQLYEAARHYLDPLEYTLLIVNVIRAKNLKKADWFGLSDPYVRINFSENDAWPSKWRSKIIKQNLSPEWHETVYFLLTPAYDHFTIEVYDDDGNWKKDDFLGRVSYPLAREYIEHKAWRALDEGQGEIEIRHLNIPISALFDAPIEKRRADPY
jgi:hypothetical protein